MGNVDKRLKEAIEVDAEVTRISNAMFDTLLGFNLKRFTAPMDVRCLAAAKLTLALVFQKAKDEGVPAIKQLHWIESYMESVLEEYEESQPKKEK